MATKEHDDQRNITQRSNVHALKKDLDMKVKVEETLGADKDIEAQKPAKTDPYMVTKPARKRRPVTTDPYME